MTDGYLEVAEKNLGYRDVEQLIKLKHKALMKVTPINRNERLFSMGAICNVFDLKRDAYNKYQKRILLRGIDYKQVLS